MSTYYVRTLQHHTTQNKRVHHLGLMYSDGAGLRLKGVPLLYCLRALESVAVHLVEVGHRPAELLHNC